MKNHLTPQKTPKEEKEYHSDNRLDEGEKTVRAYLENKEGSRSYFKITKKRAEQIKKLQAWLKSKKQ